MTRLSEVLEQAGYATFVPHRDGLECYALNASSHPKLAALAGALAGSTLSKAIFALDTFQVLSRCDGLVCNLNGRVPDEGAVAEAAMAFTAGKPVVLYKNDERSLSGGLDNSMVVGLTGSFATVPRLNRIPGELERAFARSLRTQRPGPLPPAPAVYPPAVQRVVERGRLLWRLLERLRVRLDETDCEVEALVAALDEGE